MTTKFNGHVHNGWALPGKGELLTIYTVHDVADTGVLATRAELLEAGAITSATLSGSNSVTVEGVTYTTDAAYDDALYQQKNLNTLVQHLAMRNTVSYVNVFDGVATTTSPTVDFASAFLGTDTFGTSISAGNNSGTAKVWKVQVMLQGKGYFVPAANKGDVTVGTGDNYGDSIDNLDAALAGLSMIATSNTNTTTDVDVSGGAVAVGASVPISIDAATRSIVLDVVVGEDFI